MERGGPLLVGDLGAHELEVVLKLEHHLIFVPLAVARARVPCVRILRFKLGESTQFRNEREYPSIYL